MDKMTVAHAVRKLVVDASGLDAAQELKIFGVTFDPAGKRQWAEEFITGGETTRLTCGRVRISGLILEYHFNVHAGNSVESALRMVNACTDAIHPDDRITVSGADCFVEKVKTERAESRDWNTVKLIVTVSAADAG